jgi:energy-coupling factor transporter transmembrane protein EcfT
MLLLVLLAVLAIVLFGLGFTLHWLFIIAVIAALVFLIMLFVGGAGGRTRGAWWSPFEVASRERGTRAALRGGSLRLTARGLARGQW